MTTLTNEMQIKPESEGVYVSWKWLVGVFFTIMFMIVAAWGRMVQNNLAQIAPLQQKSAVLENSQQNMKEQLDRIENKINLLIPVKK